MMIKVTEGIRVLTDAHHPRKVSFIALVDEYGTVSRMAFKPTRREWDEAYTKIRAIRRRNADD